MSQRPVSSHGGRKAGGAQRVRSLASRQGMPRRSTGSSRRARTSTYWRLAAAATCWAIRLLAAPRQWSAGGPRPGVRAQRRVRSGAACSPRNLLGKGHGRPPCGKESERRKTPSGHPGRALAGGLSQALQAVCRIGGRIAKRLRGNADAGRAADTGMWRRDARVDGSPRSASQGHQRRIPCSPLGPGVHHGDVMSKARRR